MDLQAFEDDVTKVLKLIPKELVHVVADLATKMLTKYRNELPVIAMHAVATLQSHVKAAGLELSTGITKLEELEPVLVNALNNVIGNPKLMEAKENAQTGQTG